MPQARVPAFIVLSTSALIAGCAGTPDQANAPDQEDPSSANNEPSCPTFKTLVVDGDRYYCVDDDLLEDRDW
jgi:hypothetical protein